jgi:hypothetical protein
MSEVNRGAGAEMLDADIRRGAAELVAQQEPNALMEIPDYPGMYVGLASDNGIQPLHFFTARDQRYAVGPLKKE